MEVVLAGLIVHVTFSWRDLAVMAVEVPYFQDGFDLSLSECCLVISINQEFSEAKQMENNDFGVWYTLAYMQTFVQM